MINRIIILFSVFVIFLSGACQHDPILNAEDYPPEIGNIMVTKCAISGCHNALSASNAEGVDLSNWEKMMNGRDLGAVVIPYSNSQSLAFLYVNTFADLGAIIKPTMPKNAVPLSRDEVLKIRFWINAGAPNKDGFVKWSDNPQRRKYYIANRGCDIIASVDPISSLVMRYIDVGHVFEIEKPSNVKVSPDGIHWYVSFANSDILQQYSTINDQKTRELLIGFGNWSSMCISSDSKTAYLVNTDSTQSELAVVDLETMTLKKKYSTSLLGFAINLSLNEQSNLLYIGSQRGNFFYTVDISDPLQAIFHKVPIRPGEIADINGIDNPTAIYVNPGSNRLYITCTGTGQLNEYNASNNQLTKSLFAGYTPQNIAYDPTHDILYIACTDDSTTLTGHHGYITIIDATSFSVIDKVYTETQPYGLALDATLGRLIIANRNFSSMGPPPHHHVECEGRVGSFSYIDLNTLTLINEEGFYLSVEPFSIAIRN